jgi:hypothetical protein
MDVYMLIRYLSPYTEADLILGVFTDKNKAEEARSVYIAKTLEYDKHCDQGYMDVDLEKDVVIKKFVMECSSNEAHQKSISCAIIPKVWDKFLKFQNIFLRRNPQVYT